MRFYAERPLRLAWQLVADVLVVAWVASASVARASHAVVLRLQDPGTAAGRGRRRIRRRLRQRRDHRRPACPFVGDDLARALGTGSHAGASLVASGQEQVATIETMAAGTAASVCWSGRCRWCWSWLSLRVRYARAARLGVIVRRDDPTCWPCAR